MPGKLNLGREELEQLKLGELRSMCTERRIPIAGGAHRNTCVEKLLHMAWIQYPTGDLPWNLEGLGQDSLEQLHLKALRFMCTERRISVAGGAHRKRCVKELLTWKAAALAEAAAPAADQATAQLPGVLPDQSGAWRSQLKDMIRDNVHRHRGALSRESCAYTLRPLGGIAHSKDAPELDHVFECQALRDVLCRVTELRQELSQLDLGVKTFNKQPMVVQNALAHARDVHNRPEFLVMCGSLANKQKQGAFQSSLNKLARGEALERGIEEDLLRTFTHGEYPYEEAVAEKIARTVVDRLRGIEDSFAEALRDVPQGTAQGNAQQARYDDLAEEVVQLYEQFEVTRRV